MTGQVQEVRGFLEGTALRKISGPRINAPIDLHSGITQGILPRNGYGAFIRLHLHVKIGKTGLVYKDAYTDAYSNDGNEVPGTVATRQGIYRLLDNIQLLNNKGLTPINASAHDLAVLADKKRFGIDTFSKNIEVLEVGGDTIIHAVVDLPLAPNLGRAALWGLIGLQSNTAEWTVKVQWSDLAQVFDGITDDVRRAAYIESSLYYFDVPNPAMFAQPPLSYAYMVRGQTVAGGTVNTGDFFHELSPLGGTLMRLLVGFTDKAGKPFETHRGDYYPPAAGTANIKRLRTVIDNTDFLHDLSALEHEAWHEDVYGKRPLPGWFTFLDGLTVLDTQIGEFMGPDFMHGFISPDNYASVKAVSQIDLNGTEAGEVRVIQEYLQALR